MDSVGLLFESIEIWLWNLFKIYININEMIITTFNLISRDSVSQKTSCQNLVNLKIMVTSLAPLTIAVNLKPMQR